MKILNCLGTRCPIPIIKTAELTKEMALGEKITLLSDDPATWPDLQAWGRMKNQRVQQLLEHEFLITKSSN